MKWNENEPTELKRNKMEFNKQNAIISKKMK